MIQMLYLIMNLNDTKTNFNFKSQICTTRKQSERLLKLGLKKESRDVVLKKYIHNDKYCYKPVFEDIDDRLIDCDDLYPAWSLHRLIKMMPEKIDRYFCTGFLTLSKHNVYYNESVDGAPDMEFEKNNLYESILSCIEWLIKNGYFPKEYLV